MNRFIISFIVLLLFFGNSCNGKQNDAKLNDIKVIGNADSSTKIEVRVKGYDSGKVYLVGYYTGNPYIVDSAEISAGVILFEPKENYKPGYYFINLPDNKTVQLLLDKDQNFKMTTVSGDLVKSMMIDGSLDNKLMYEEFIYADSINTLIKDAQKELEAFIEGDIKYNEIKEKIDSYVKDKKSYLNNIFTKYPNSFFTTFKKSGQNPDPEDVRNPDGSVNTSLQIYLYRRAFWNDVDFSDIRLLYTPVISNKLSKYIKDLTPQHQDSIISAASYLIDKVKKYPEYFSYFANWITLQYEPGKSTLMDAEAVYVFMIKSYFTYNLAFWSDSTTIYRLQKRADEMMASLIGKKGPDVISKDPLGNTKSIYGLKSPYIIVFMYSPNCEHCQEQIPKLKKFYEEWKNKGVSIFAIALDTKQEEWINLVKQSGLTEWTNVFDPTNHSIYAKYYVDNTPELYVLNPERIIIGKNLKVNQVETIINRDKENR